MIEIIQPTSISLMGRRRVAIYARVSSDKDAAENSLDSQIAYFKKKVSSNPAWMLAGIYTDNGISGTLVTRPAFQQMMMDARSGKIDYIITKSITRFARNTVVLLESIRELKSLGIDVEFENDHLHSISPQGELLLSLLAMHAEEQSKSASDNKRWQIKRYFESGIPTYTRMYGYEMKNNHFEIIPEEAAVIRQIFELYLSGKGPYAIARTLNAEGKLKWGHKWRHSNIYQILRNEKYKGDMILQKTYIEDFRTKRGRINHGEVDKYYVHESHDAIISPEVFDITQAEIERRKQPTTGVRETEYLFTGLILCGCCKAHFMRKMNPSSTGKYPIWKCQNRIHGGSDRCTSKQIRESILIEKTKAVLGLPEDQALTRDIITNNFTAIESVAGDQLRYFYANGHVDIVSWQNDRSSAWTPEKREEARKRALLQHGKEVK